MRFKSLKIRDYRTLESIDLDFPSVYSAICGANDSGKTNIIRAIRALVRDDGGGFSPFMDSESPSLKDDYPKWKSIDPQLREISLSATIELSSVRDAGFHEFVATQLSIQQPPSSIELTISVAYRVDSPDPEVTVTAVGAEHKDLRAQEVLKKLQSSKHPLPQLD